MSKVHIVTDSSICLPTRHPAYRFPVTIAPIRISGDLQTIEDDSDLPPAELAAFFDSCDTFPSANPPSAETFRRIYENLRQETDQILSIHSSGAMCSIVAEAEKASQHYLGRSSIQVIDSKTLSIGLGLIVQAAVEAAERNRNLEDCVRIVRGMIPRVYAVFFLEDLSYLDQNGMITRSQAILGNMLGIIAFLTMEDGQIIPMEKVRSRPRAIEKMVEFVSEFSTVQHIAILKNGAASRDEVTQLSDRLQSLHPTTPLTLHTYGPSTATCIGPRSLGVIVLEAEEDFS
ncbi:MAG: DegV family protein [Anaerolineales bacterium]|nr:DegV family protein [Anaerolineales bacterium]